MPPYSESGSRFDKEASYKKKKRHRDKSGPAGQPQLASASLAKPAFGKKQRRIVAADACKWRGAQSVADQLPACPLPLIQMKKGSPSILVLIPIAHRIDF
jgi:hypothetical protein